jgi:hypothetical protein
LSRQGLTKVSSLEKWVEKVLHHEDRLLRALCFDLIVEHPHLHLLTMTKLLDRKCAGQKEFRFDKANLELSAWGFLNDR